jgi:hypothetical protein
MEVRRARSGPGLWPGPRRQARWVGRGLRGQGSALAKQETRRRRALDAGGAGPDNARRSGPVPVILSSGDWRIWRTTTGPASSPGAVMHGALRRVVRHGGVRGNGAAGSGPRRRALAQEEAGQAAPTCGETPHHPLAAPGTAPPARSTFLRECLAHAASTARAGRPGAPKVCP